MGFDVFTTKCGAHNYLVPSRSSCPICVSAKRSQLHAANLAHMPRYLFEQQLDVKSTPQGTPEAVPLTADKPCDVRWKVNFKSNYIVESYVKLSVTTQALLMALDVTTDARLLKIRQDYQAQIDSATSPSEQHRMRYSLAIDMYHEIVRVSKGRIEEPELVTGQFVGYFRALYNTGQRLIIDEPTSKPARYVLNFPSGASADLNSTTRALLRKLDKYEDGLGPLRMKHQKLIKKHLSVYQFSVKAMAKDLWDVVTVTLDSKACNSMKVRDQFLAEVERSWAAGQRLTDTLAPVSVSVPTKYRLTMHSLEWPGHQHLLSETQEAFRVLELGIPAVYQKWYGLCECIAKRTTTVESMAYTMWDTLGKQPELCELKGDMTIRQDFVTRFKYLYNVGEQRIVIEETPEMPRTQPPSVDDDLAGWLYNYLGTSSKELYHEQALFEGHLDREFRGLTREGLIGAYRNLAGKIVEAYRKDKMYDWRKVSFNTLCKLQERLADAYLERKRR